VIIALVAFKSLHYEVSETELASPFHSCATEAEISTRRSLCAAFLPVTYTNLYTSPILRKGLGR
jgi:hypothetical protein